MHAVHELRSQVTLVGPDYPLLGDAKLPIRKHA